MTRYLDEADEFMIKMCFPEMSPKEIKQNYFVSKYKYCQVFSIDDISFILKGSCNSHAQWDPKIWNNKKAVSPNIYRMIDISDGDG